MLSTMQLKRSYAMPAALRSNASCVLGDGLVLRWSTARDTERIATLHSLVHRDHTEEAPNTNAMKVIFHH